MLQDHLSKRLLCLILMANIMTVSPHVNGTLYVANKEYLINGNEFRLPSVCSDAELSRAAAGEY